jgi:PilZ domain
MTQLRDNPMRRERRKNFRVERNSLATIYHGEFARPCILTNFSNGGARVAGVRADTFPEEFMLRLTPLGRIHKCRVLWRTNDALGVRFTDNDTSPAKPIIVGQCAKLPVSVSV